MSKFCTKCGNELLEAGAFCRKCGAAVNEAGPIAGDNPVKQASAINNLLKMFNTANEDNATLNLGGTELKVSLIMKVIAGVLFLLLFLPIVSVSMGILGSQSANGWDAIGEGNFWVVFMLLVPLALFAAFQFKQHMQFLSGKLFIAALGMTALGLLACIIFAISIPSIFSISMGIGWWLSLLIYIVATAVSAGCFMSAKNRP